VPIAEEDKGVDGSFRLSFKLPSIITFVRGFKNKIHERFAFSLRGL
jgi:hypothetical protein